MLQTIIRLSLISGALLSTNAYSGAVRAQEIMELRGTCEFLVVNGSCSHSRGKWHQVSEPTDNCKSKSACCITNVPESLCKNISFGPSTPHIRMYEG